MSDLPDQLSDRAREEIERRWPTIDLAEVNRAFLNYLADLNFFDDVEPSTSEPSAQLVSFAKAANKLAAQYQTLSIEDREGLNRISDVFAGQRLESWARATAYFAQEYVDRLKLERQIGRQVNSRMQLVAHLEAILTDGGYTLQSARKGALSKLLEIVGEEIGETWGREEVRYDLTKWENLDR